jgi:hypothetical protein
VVTDAWSYQNIAGGLASEMAGFLRSAESRESSPPFRLVIIGKQGGVVFECEVGQDWKVENLGPAGRGPSFPFSSDGFAARRLVVYAYFPHRARAARRQLKLNGFKFLKEILSEKCVPPDASLFDSLTA